MLHLAYPTWTSHALTGIGEFYTISPWLLGVRWLVPLCYTLLIPLGAVVGPVVEGKKIR